MLILIRYEILLVRYDIIFNILYIYMKKTYLLIRVLNRALYKVIILLCGCPVVALCAVWDEN